MDDNTTLSTTISHEQLTLTLQGRLDTRTVADLWPQCFSACKAKSFKLLTIDASKVDYCDGSGVSLLLALKEYQQAEKCDFLLIGLAEQFRKLFDNLDKLVATHAESSGVEEEAVEHLGHLGFNFGQHLKQNFMYLGELCYETAKGLVRPKTIRWQDVWRVIEDTGPNAFFIIVLMGFLIGLIIAFQSAIPLQRFGAQIYVTNLVGIGLTRELGPLMTAILLAGRTASSFAAEIGTMKVNQEIDVLETMGLSPILFLAVPRVIAVMLMTPILNIFMILFGLLGAAVFMNSVGYSWPIFYNQLVGAVHLKDLLGGLFKSVIFGVIIAGIGCMHGLRTKFGASSVGESTTKAVVSCIIMIVIVDGIFAVLFYALGI